MIFPEYYEAGSLAQVAILLWEGWGYNLFKVENQMRADSLLIRSKVSHILGQAQDSLKAAESTYRREKLPMPTRANPDPAPEALAGARTLESLVREVGSLEGKIRSAPVPENDRLWQRYRHERALLERLVQADRDTVGKAEVFRRGVKDQNGEWLIANEKAVREVLASLADSVRTRSDLLTV